MERFAIDPVSLLDPATNERWGKWILAEEIARHGLNWQAVGKYHSPNSERGRKYEWLVYYHSMKAKEPPTNKRRFLMPTKKLILRTYLTPEEFNQIKTSASKAGLSLSTFSKKVCLGFSVPSLESQEARTELRLCRSDLGRLGGSDANLCSLSQLFLLKFLGKSSR